LQVDPGIDEVVTETSDGWERARYRLGDLEGRERRLAIAMLVLLMVPFVVALVRAFRDGWMPSGDEANIAIRALDVFSHHPPLTGLPSTSALYGDGIATNHPGPIEFYLLAVPLRTLGFSVGPLFSAAAINAGCVLIAWWVFFRRLGLTAMLWAGVLLLGVMWSGGTAVLTDTLSSNMTMYSLLCTAVLAWALIDGDLRLLPLAVFVASYAAQQHLAALFIVAVLAVVTIAALATRVVVRMRRRDPTITRALLRWSAVAFVVFVACWLPVAIDQFTGHPGNVTKIVNFARDNTRPTLGLKVGLYQAVHAAIPTILVRTNTTGSVLIDRPGAVHLVIGILVVAALAMVLWGLRRRAPAVSRLALVGLVLLGAGVVNGSNVATGRVVAVAFAALGSHGFESERINLYRWTWAAAFVTWAALGIGVVYLLSVLVRRRSLASRAVRLGPPALVVIAALITSGIVFVSGNDDHNREVPEFAIEKGVNAAVLARIDRRQPVLVVAVGQDASLSVAPSLILRLVEAGVKVEVQSYLATSYGTNRAYRSGAPWIVVTSGHAVEPAGPGELIWTRPFGPERGAAYDALAARRTALLDELSAAALGSKVEWAPGAQHLIERKYPGLDGFVVGSLLLHMSTDPRAAFGDSRVLQLILDGVLRSPAVDLANVRRVLDLPAYNHRGTWGDEQVAVHFLTPAQAAPCEERPCFTPD
jgi:hypothetical protein